MQTSARPLARLLGELEELEGELRLARLCLRRRARRRLDATDLELLERIGRLELARHYIRTSTAAPGVARRGTHV